MESIESKQHLLSQIALEASTEHHRIHVIETNSGWAVKKEGAKRATYLRTSRKSAISAVSNFKKVSSIVIHTKNGRILEKVALVN